MESLFFVQEFLNTKVTKVTKEDLTRRGLRQTFVYFVSFVFKHLWLSSLSRHGFGLSELGVN